MVDFEKEVLDYLNLPSVPRKEWDGNSSFNNGVAVIALKTGGVAYAVASFDAEIDASPNIKKVFSCEPFSDIIRVFVVPEYMETNIKDADLDEESKKKAQEILNEAMEIENEGISLYNRPPVESNPYLFDFIHNDEEAVAFIASYNKKNKIQGKIPKKHETILMRLAVIYSETNKEDNFGVSV